MRILLLIASVSVVFAADAEAESKEAVVEDEPKAEALKVEPKPAESAYYQRDSQEFRDGLELMRHRDEQFRAERKHLLEGQSPSRDRQYPPGLEIDENDHYGPVILRTPGPLPHDGHPDIEAQNKIIADVFSPDYYQPTWVLDYRYLKTGGRDYTRGPGGQILILPKGVRSKEPKEFPDYDAYIEHLRLSRMKERDHHQRRGEDYGHHDRPQHRHEQGHGQTLWHKYG